MPRSEAGLTPRGELVALGLALGHAAGGSRLSLRYAPVYRGRKIIVHHRCSCSANAAACALLTSGVK